MNNPQFSIITITFNSEKTIERTLRSVLAQTNKDYEYIIVDGASKDSTMDIVRKYEPLFEGRIKWVSEPDKGIYNAMNKGIARSTGEIIGIVNSDDWLEPTALESVYEASKKISNIRGAIICGSMRFYYDSGKFQVMNSNKERFYRGIKNHSFGYGAYHPSMFVGADVYKKIGAFDEHFFIAADIDFVYRCYLSGILFHFIDDILNNMSDGGVSNALAFKKILSDTRYDAKKRNLSIFCTIYIVSMLYLKQFVKELLPTKLISKYRSNKLSQQ